MLSFEENVRAVLECNFTGFKDEIINTAVKSITELNSQKTGEWLMPADGYNPKIWRRCSACGKHFKMYDEYEGFNGNYMRTKEIANFCKVCGAKMEEHE